ncbi:MAG: hypothetical protein VX780_10420 [Pseudomonadota bacterium]|nr:hypothetical protein [Pseudomonadota bacterium]
MKSLIITIFLTIAVFVHCNAAISEEFKTINTRDGVTISFIKNTPLKVIRAAAVLFAGGHGDIGINVEKKTVDSKNNFLVRSRDSFAKFGVLAITPDIPSDTDSLKNDRGKPDYQTDISFLVKEIRKLTTKPIWLIGTSRGSITVGYHAAALDIQGAILTATVTTGGHDTVFSADLGEIKVPALVVHHENDQCGSSPADGAKELLRALANSKNKQIILYRKGKSGNSNDCGGMSPHGFLGIENQVVSAITDWMFNAVE